MIIFMLLLDGEVYTTMDTAVNISDGLLRVNPAMGAQWRGFVFFDNRINELPASAGFLPSTAAKSHNQRDHLKMENGAPPKPRGFPMN